MINLVILVGNIGVDADIKTFEGGARKATITLATSAGYYDTKNTNQWVARTDWHYNELSPPPDHSVPSRRALETSVLLTANLVCISRSEPG